MTDARVPLNALIDLRLGRREAIGGLAASAAFGLFGGAAEAAAPAARGSSLRFAEIAHGLDGEHHVPPGYKVEIVLRWGDKVAKDAPAFDPLRQTAAAQLKQFSYDNDFLAFMPLPRGSTSSTRGLLCSNHERTTPHLMFPGVTEESAARLPQGLCEVEMASQGHAIVEIRKTGGAWKVVEDSPYNRKVNALDTRIRLAGPAAGHRRLATAADPEATTVIGTLNNCAGGTTPWGTILTCEENLHNYFIGNPDAGPEAAARKRYGINGRGRYVWGNYFARFNLDREANEPNRFGWVVEIDPYDPASTPVKRTALGRFKHEGATAAVGHDGRVAVYMGDDERMEYLYKFVTEGRHRPGDAAANRDLLDRGTLYVAKFEADGKMTWLPLVHGSGPLNATNVFWSQPDVVIEARRAADLVGATPMDRPEDVEPDPRTGKVYVALTYNERRTAQQVNPANPRANNRYGHILEIAPPTVGGRPDHAASEARWEVLMLCGDPAKPDQRARYGAGVSANGWLTTPDNLAFDPRGRLWITTDGQDDAAGFADSAYAAEVSGPARGVPKLFFNAPRGAEVCGPCFTPDGRTLFLAIQHPAEEKDSTFDKPSTRWPDFKPDLPPRPSVIAITKADGGEVGS